MEAISTHRFAQVSADGGTEKIARDLAVEIPVAVEVNGIGYAVLMASPSDPVDLAYGFLLTERLIDCAAELHDVDVHESDGGMIVRAFVAEPSADRLIQRIRHRTADSSCGLCGIETLEQALRPLPRIENRWRGPDSAIFVARGLLDDWQPLNRATGAVHAAARCAGDGRVLAVREDVGRHNAFDKLIGHMLRSGDDWDDGFALLTSRCSYELVEKAAIAGCPLLATLSAPTGLAVRRAAEAGLALRVLARSDALLASGP